MGHGAPAALRALPISLGNRKTNRIIAAQHFFLVVKISTRYACDAFAGRDRRRRIAFGGTFFATPRVARRIGEDPLG
jgi:hypothetical protein